MRVRASGRAHEQAFSQKKPSKKRCDSFLNLRYLNQPIVIFMFYKNYGTQFVSLFLSLLQRNRRECAGGKDTEPAAIRKQRQLKHKYNGETVKWKKSKA